MDELRVSIGTASVLGLADVRLDADPTTAYLMVGSRCAMHCAFCAQAGHSQAPASTLSRVSWPLFPTGAVIEALLGAFSRGRVRRCCLQVTVSEEGPAQALDLIRRVRRASNLPVDASILPRDRQHVSELFAAGLDHLGFGLDAATERVFQMTKGGRWDRMWQMMADAAHAFPGHIAAHLIVGLGETERDMIETIQALHRLGVIVGLFAFTPVPGTALAECPPPSLDTYRRVQAARWLIVHDIVSLRDIGFDRNGRVRHYGIPDWRERLAHGDAFRTSGCPDCNRPYYNERPSGPMYNYPWELSGAETMAALAECRMGTDSPPWPSSGLSCLVARRHPASDR